MLKAIWEKKQVQIVDMDVCLAQAARFNLFCCGPLGVSGVSCVCWVPCQKAGRATKGCITLQAKKGLQVRVMVLVPGHMGWEVAFLELFPDLHPESLLRLWMQSWKAPNHRCWTDIQEKGRGNWDRCWKAWWTSSCTFQTHHFLGILVNFKINYEMLRCFANRLFHLPASWRNPLAVIHQHPSFGNGPMSFLDLSLLRPVSL